MSAVCITTTLLTQIRYIAAKTYYFGVGGGTRQFEALVRADGAMAVQSVFDHGEGVRREILRLSWA